MKELQRKCQRLCNADSNSSSNSNNTNKNTNKNNHINNGNKKHNDNVWLYRVCECPRLSGFISVALLAFRMYCCLPQGLWVKASSSQLMHDSTLDFTVAEVAYYNFCFHSLLLTSAIRLWHGFLTTSDTKP